MGLERKLGMIVGRKGEIVGALGTEMRHLCRFGYGNVCDRDVVVVNHSRKHGNVTCLILEDSQIASGKHLDDILNLNRLQPRNVDISEEPRLVIKGLFDCTSNHELGLGPRTRSGVCAFDSGPRTRSDILPPTRSGDKNRRLIFLPLMSDSVRSPRCLVGAFDVGLGPDSLRLDPV
ncbi:hypothetical protein LXL04_010395 [Taraxacum kok-saghyz]